MVRRSRQRKVKPGDGRALKPYQRWHPLYRSQFEIDHDGHHYTLDVDFFDWNERAYLYRDGLQVAFCPIPASFPVPGGQIETDWSTYGMKRAHLVVAESGTATQMHAAPGTAEAWRARLAVRHPRLSRVLAVASVVVLVVALAVWAPQAVQTLTQIPAVAEWIGGPWTSPVHVPSWLQGALAFGGVAAGMERALSLRNHWLIDADTWWLG